MSDSADIQIEAISIVLKEMIKNNTSLSITINSKANALENSAKSRSGGTVSDLVQDNDYLVASALKKLLT